MKKKGNVVTKKKARRGREQGEGQLWGEKGDLETQYGTVDWGRIRQQGQAQRSGVGD